MSAAKVVMWRRIEALLREYEDSTQAEAKEAIAKSYSSLRQQLQVVAIETADDEELT